MSNPLDFTEKDYELIAECITAWENEPYNKDSADFFAVAIVKAATQKATGVDLRDEGAKVMKTAREKSAARQKTVIMLKAKIEHARQLAQQAAIAAAKGE